MVNEIEQEPEPSSEIKQIGKDIKFYGQIHSPLPPPQMLDQYEKAYPGTIKEIIELTKAQGNHRREMERLHLEGQINHQKRRDCEAKIGQVFAFLFSIIALGIGAFAVIHGYPGAGSFISMLGIGTIVTRFIDGRKT